MNTFSIDFDSYNLLELARFFDEKGKSFSYLSANVNFIRIKSFWKDYCLVP